jgi:hypothetical protein
MAYGQLFAAWDKLSENTSERNVLIVLFCEQVHPELAIAKREKRKERDASVDASMVAQLRSQRLG